MLNDIGRVCIKIAGRDAGKKCVIVDVIDNNHVLIDGETRRRKCNIIHLEPMTQVLTLDQAASHDAVKEAFTSLGITLTDKKVKEKTEKPVAKSSKKNQKEPSPEVKDAKKSPKKGKT